MPASTRHILTNVERMAADDELSALWDELAQGKNDDGTERTVLQTWTLFVKTADDRRIADRIPGTTGRTFKAKYADERAPQPDTKPAAKRPARKRLSAARVSK